MDVIMPSDKTLYTTQQQQISRPVYLKVTVLQLSDTKWDCTWGYGPTVLELNYPCKAAQGYVAPNYNLVHIVTWYTKGALKHCGAE